MREKKNIIELTNCTVEEYHKKRKLPLIVLADNVRSMQNLGSVFRTSDAFMIEKVVLGGISGCPPHPEISKTALGADESVDWEYTPSPFEYIENMKKEGWKVCALEQAHDSIMLQEFHPSIEERYILVIGNEVEGVDQKIVDASDHILEIPQHGVKHSLNVSVSCGIALWHFFSKLMGKQG